MVGLTQFMIGCLGLAAMWLSLGQDPMLRAWAPYLGLLGQPFWLHMAVTKRLWGVGIMAVAYTAVYLHAIL